MSAKPSSPFDVMSSFMSSSTVKPLVLGARISARMRASVLECKKDVGTLCARLENGVSLSITAAYPAHSEEEYHQDNDKDYQ